MNELEIAIKAVQTYAEMHPRPLHVTKTQAAEMLGISRWLLADLIRHGKIEVNGFNKIHISEVDRVLVSKD